MLSFLFLELKYINSNYETNNNTPIDILQILSCMKNIQFSIVSSRRLLFFQLVVNIILYTFELYNARAKWDISRLVYFVNHY